MLSRDVFLIHVIWCYLNQTQINKRKAPVMLTKIFFSQNIPTLRIWNKSCDLFLKDPFQKCEPFSKKTSMWVYSSVSKQQMSCTSEMRHAEKQSLLTPCYTVMYWFLGICCVKLLSLLVHRSMLRADWARPLFILLVKQYPIPTVVWGDQTVDK